MSDPMTTEIKPLDASELEFLTPHIKSFASTFWGFNDGQEVLIGERLLATLDAERAKAVEARHHAEARLTALRETEQELRDVRAARDADRQRIAELEREVMERQYAIQTRDKWLDDHNSKHDEDAATIARLERIEAAAKAIIKYEDEGAPDWPSWDGYYLALRDALKKDGE